MNINENVENRGKTRGKTMAIARFWLGYMIYLASLGPTQHCENTQVLREAITEDDDELSWLPMWSEGPL